MSGTGESDIGEHPAPAEGPDPAAAPSTASAPSVHHDWREIVVPESLDGARLDKCVAQLLPELSRARVKRAIDLGAVRVNSRRLPKGGTVTRGDVLRVDFAQVVDGPAVATPGAPLDVVLETAEVLVVAKPAG
ncbi:MAG: S4 domain-containing protein, partial [Polyangiaceae bacterium]